jgi:hypothetical protein
MRKIRALVIHHTDSNFGTVDVVRAWHLARGFTDIGYHKLVLNGKRSPRSTYDTEIDGLIQQGRPDAQRGAHSDGKLGPYAGRWNTVSLGICLVGNFEVDRPTPRQWASLVDACVRLCRRHGIMARDIYGHRETDQTACPGRNLDLNLLRQRVAAGLGG